jgi:GT2 family glycosyltransferase
MIAIVILNWNGWQDSLECLSSLQKSRFKDYQIILIDNGSTDESLEKIRAWSVSAIPVTVGPEACGAESYSLELIETTPDCLPGLHIKADSKHLLLVKNPENIGFAAGSNIGISYAVRNNFEQVMLLNNDTTIAPDCLSELHAFTNSHPEYCVVTPKICYYNEPKKIWNCGGKLTAFGGRKYLNQDCSDESVPSEPMQITFLTGCALYARTSVFDAYGPLSENFFFGEEDYEFCLRMKKNKIKLAAVRSATVFHKIGSSEKTVFSSERYTKAYIHYLNRFIDMKTYYPSYYWHVWRLLMLGYIIPFLKIRFHIPLGKLVKLISLLLTNSRLKNKVTKQDFYLAREI